MSAKIFQELEAKAPVMLWRSGLEKQREWFDQSWLDFTGRTLEEEEGFGWTASVHPEDLEACLAQYTAAFDARQKFNISYRLRRRDGVHHWLVDVGAPFTVDGVFAGYFGSCADITEQRKARDQLVRTTEERDALLREVYHRVKNNLQQVEGLIAIESASVADTEVRRALQALSGRVRAMGAVHQRLIRSGGMIELPLGDFITGLCADLAHSLGAEQRGIAITTHADAGVMHIEQAVIIGLLINELVTNALKHAFPNGSHGHVIVRCQQSPSGLVLQVEDDGVGMGGAGDLSEQSGGTGTRLIKGFVRQLHGQLEIDRTAGTRMTVTIRGASAGNDHAACAVALR